MRNKTVLLLVLVLLVVGGWTAGWFYVRERVIEGVESGIANLRENGVEITCPDRSASGWPFRIEVRCVGPIVELADGTRILASAAAATGHVTDPNLIVAAFETPLTVHLPDGTVTQARFDRLRSSLRLAGNRMQRLSVAAEGFDIATGPEGLTLGRFAANAGEAHLGAVEGDADTLRLTVTVTGGTGTIGLAEILPIPANAGLDATVDRASVVGGSSGSLAAWARAGGRLEISEAAVEIGEARLSATGSATVSDAGLANGSFLATASRIDWLTDLAKAGTPLPPVLTGLASAFLIIGKPVAGDGNPRQVTVEVADGAVRTNGLKVADVPPLF